MIIIPSVKFYLYAQNSGFMPLIKSFIFVILCISFSVNLSSQGVPINYLLNSQEFLQDIRDKKDVSAYLKIYETCDIDKLSGQLGTDDQKFAFWVNIYNAYIQVILSAQPKKYDDRRIFFGEKQINIGGQLMSFADIEHGILRRSQNQFFLGYVTRFFPSSLEKKLRVNKRDYRIHFALNCGAKSCPPVAIYDWTRLSEQFDKSSKAYLKKFTNYNKEEKTAYVTNLFSWFRGDFGGLDGIKEILLKYQLIPDKNTRIKTSTYDWTLDLGNFINL